MQEKGYPASSTCGLPIILRPGDLVLSQGRHILFSSLTRLAVASTPLDSILRLSSGSWRTEGLPSNLLLHLPAA